MSTHYQGQQDSAGFNCLWIPVVVASALHIVFCMSTIRATTVLLLVPLSLIPVVVASIVVVWSSVIRSLIRVRLVSLIMSLPVSSVVSSIVVSSFVSLPVTEREQETNTFQYLQFFWYKPMFFKFKRSILQDDSLDVLLTHNNGYFIILAPTRNSLKSIKVGDHQIKFRNFTNLCFSETSSLKTSLHNICLWRVAKMMNVKSGSQAINCECQWSTSLML